MKVPRTLMYAENSKEVEAAKARTIIRQNAHGVINQTIDKTSARKIEILAKGLSMLISKVHQKVVQYVSLIAWVFDFRKFITITDVSLQAMHIACSPIPRFCSQHGITHERLTKYLFPWGVE